MLWNENTFASIVIALIRALPCLALLVLASCKGPSAPPPHDVDVGVVRITAYLPFVEAVVIPQPVYAGEQIEIQISVSALKNPWTLAGFGTASVPEGRNRSFLYPFGELYRPDSGAITGIHVESWVEQTHPEPGPVSDHTVLYFASLPAGSYTFQISSTDTRENGGTEGQCVITPWAAPPHFRTLCCAEV